MSRKKSPPTHLVRPRPACRRRCHRPCPPPILPVAAIMLKPPLAPFAVVYLLRALAHGTSPLQHGLAEHTADSATLQEAASEALLAALGAPCRGLTAAEPASLEGHATAAAAAIEACGLPAVVSGLLELGADPSFTRQADGLCPLVAALSGGHLEAAKQLLDAGAQPDPPPWAAAAAAAGLPANGGSAAAASSAAGGSCTSKRKRLEPGSGTGSATSSGAAAAAAHPTPLVLAVVAGSRELVQQLLSLGADPNQQCTVQLAEGQAPVALTPLVAAVQTGSTSLVDCLLAAGADIHQKCVSPGSGGADWTRCAGGVWAAGRCSRGARLALCGALLCRCGPR